MEAVPARPDGCGRHFSRPGRRCAGKQGARSVLPHLETQWFLQPVRFCGGTDLPERVELARYPSRTGYEVAGYQQDPRVLSMSRELTAPRLLGSQQRAENESRGKEWASSDQAGRGLKRGLEGGQRTRQTVCRARASIPPLSSSQRSGRGERVARGTAAESKRRASAEAALAASFRCRRQW